MKRIGLIQFPGSNCERETAMAVRRAGMQPVEFLWNESLEKLAAFDGYILVGGFSYEDRSRAGIIAALDPVLKTIVHHSQQGKPVLGICNGAQILVESGLLSQIDNIAYPLALTENKRISGGKIIGTGFYNAWINLAINPNAAKNAFTRYLKKNEPITIPAAHAQGRFMMADDALTALTNKGLNVLQYCDEQGHIVNDFPVNPNGSVANIAAIINQTGNIMAIMPHPERSSNGDAIFASMRTAIEEGQVPISNSINKPSVTAPARYIPEAHCSDLIVKLIITDNEAMTVQKTLNQRGIPVTVNRFVHWRIDCEEAALTAIKQSGVLYCARKEREVQIKLSHHDQSLYYLVEAQEDMTGQQAIQILRHDYGVAVNGLQHGILWQFTSTVMPAADLINDILPTNIIGNPYVHTIRSYEPLPQ